MRQGVSLFAVGDAGGNLPFGHFKRRENGVDAGYHSSLATSLSVPEKASEIQQVDKVVHGVALTRVFGVDRNAVLRQLHGGVLCLQPVTAAHCVWVESQDMQLLARHGATGAHCPSSILKLGSGIAPLAALQKAGVLVAIGTDGAASNNNLNMLEETPLAGLLHKGAMHDAEFLPAPALMEAACKTGALAQGRDDCGAIKPGNRADIVVYRLDSPAMLPLINPLLNLLYAGQSADVVLNIVDGRVLYQNGEF